MMAQGKKQSILMLITTPSFEALQAEQAQSEGF
jgi:hypothetical protein